MNHTVSDFVIRIKNAARARRKTVVLPYSGLTKNIGQVLVQEGFLDSVKELADGNKKSLVAQITYEKLMPRFTDVIILSKPSLRKYARKSNDKDLRGKGLGMTIVSTSQGVMTGKEAFQKGVGGELLFKIW
jgi:small subunit ribosomal protein S8